MSRFDCFVAAGGVLLALSGTAYAQDRGCQVTDIAPGVKMRAANCPTLIGRPAAMQQNRVDNVLPQAPAGLYRYSDVEMRVTGPRPQMLSPSGLPPAARKP